MAELLEMPDCAVRFHACRMQPFGHLPAAQKTAKRPVIQIGRDNSNIAVTAARTTRTIEAGAALVHVATFVALVTDQINSGSMVSAFDLEGNQVDEGGMDYHMRPGSVLDIGRAVAFGIPVPVWMHQKAHAGLAAAGEI